MNNSSLASGEASHNMLTPIDYFVIVIYVLVFIIGVTGNLLVCLFFKFENKRIKHLQRLIFYLALSDLFASITNPILFIYFQVTQYKVWHFGWLGCKLIPLTWRVFTSISVGIIMIINIDRCIALKFPFRNPPKLSKINVLLVLIIVIALLMELPYVIYADIRSGGCQVPLVSVKGYAYPVLSIMLFRDTLYLSVFLVTCAIIMLEISAKPKEQNTSQTLIRQQENRNVLKMLITVATAFIVSVFPREILHITYTLSWLIGNGIPLTTSLVHTNSILTSLLCCNTICNVVIYAKLHLKFREVIVSSVLSSISRQTSEKHLDSFDLIKFRLCGKRSLESDSQEDLSRVVC